ncbi:MAG: OmpA/MotB family protein [Bacillota bacterium]
MIRGKGGAGGDHGGGHDGAGGMRWLLTYADLITLMMVFFTVMYSMSRVDAQKFQALAGSLRSSFFSGSSGGSSGTGFMPGGAGGAEGAGGDVLEDLGYELAAETQDLSSEGSVSIYYGDRGLTISLGAVLFRPGEADILAEAKAILDKISPAISKVPNYVSVEGYTDNLPISTHDFPSNWELSARRATSVIHYLIGQSKIPAARFFVVGYGEYRPVAPNNTERNRAMNRRVDIVILKAAPVNDQGRLIDSGK